MNVLSILRKSFNNPNDLVAGIIEDKYIVLHVIDSNLTEQKILDRVKSKSSRFLEQLGSKNIKANIGIGSTAINLSELSQSYKDAWNAIEISKKNCVINS